MKEVEPRQRAERSLALMSFALNNVHEAAYLIDETGRFRYVNEEASRMLGYSRGQLLAMSVPDIDPDSTPEGWWQHWSEFREARSTRFDARHRRLDGRVVPVEITATYFEYERQDFILALVRDIDDRQKTEAALRRLNRELRAVSSCHEALIRATDEVSLLQSICRIVCEEAGYQMAWVGYAEHDAEQTLRPMAWGGTEDGYLTEITISWGEGPNGGDRPAARVIRTGAPVRIGDIANDGASSEWRSQAIARGYGSSLALPLKDVDDRTFGVMVVYAPDAHAFGPDEARLLEGLAADMAFGIAVLRARNDLHRADENRLEHVRFLENLDRANRSIQGTTDLDEMMARLLDEVLAIFDCDRAALLYPCDPSATTFSARMERTTPAYPGSADLYPEMPVDGEIAEVMRRQLSTDGPVTLGPGSMLPVPQAFAGASGVKSVMVMTVRPRTGQPWQFGIQQCSYAREWSSEERRLFAEIGHRLEDGVTALQTLRELEGQIEAHRILLEQAYDAIFVCDASWHYTDVNEAACQMLGYSREELLRLSVPDVVPPADNPGQPDRLGRLQSGTSGITERMLRRKDGTLVAAELSTRQLSDSRFQAIARDITERKRLEKEQARLATAVEQADEAIVITDPSGAILYVNPAFEHVTGYAKSEVVGGNPRILKSGKHDTEFYESMWRTLLAGETWRGTITNQRKDATLFQEEATITPIRDGASNVVNYVAVKRDVTREVALESQLNQSQKMEAVGQLAGGIAHDFNNLITAIRGYSELVREGLPPGDEARSDMDQIVLAADRAAELTKQLLAFSRRQVLLPEVIAPAEIVAGIVPMLRRLLGEHIDLVTHAAPDVGRIRVDPSQLEQIIVNLAVNARDAMHGGGRLVLETMNVHLGEGETRGAANLASGNYVVMRVTDTGSGMDEATLARAFEPFFTTKEAGQGTGMGLATVYGIVRQSGGEIELHSEIGRGTTFTIWLPRAHEERAAAAVDTGPELVPQGSGTILLVEDDPSVRAIARRTLEDLGYAVQEASNGAEAIALTARYPAHIDLLVTDVVMPRVGGGKLARRIRASRPDLPVLFMSGFSDEATRLADLSLPGATLISKPFTREALGRAVEKALKGD